MTAQSYLERCGCVTLSETPARRRDITPNYDKQSWGTRLKELLAPALLHGTRVALLEGASGGRLDEVGGGVGARLRF